MHRVLNRSGNFLSMDNQKTALVTDNSSGLGLPIAHNFVVNNIPTMIIGWAVMLLAFNIM
jgi:NADP-dependent 3-hydroxy acid dehydrogenase YdfG